MTAVSIL